MQFKVQTCIAQGSTVFRVSIKEKKRERQEGNRGEGGKREKGQYFGKQQYLQGIDEKKRSPGRKEEVGRKERWENWVNMKQETYFPQKSGKMSRPKEGNRG